MFFILVVSFSASVTGISKKTFHIFVLKIKALNKCHSRALRTGLQRSVRTSRTHSIESIAIQATGQDPMCGMLKATLLTTAGTAV